MREYNSTGVVVKGNIDNEEVSKTVKEVFEWGSSLLFAFSICFFITVFIMFFTVSGKSMLPILHDGDRLLVSKFMYVPQKGDVVTIDTNERLKKNIIKRVIATPGDTFKIDYDKHEVYVNGQILNENYINEPTISRGDGTIPSNTLITVPAEHVIVLGDNRNHSMDSRYEEIGLVSYNKIYGRAFVIHWPLDRLRFIWFLSFHFYLLRDL